MVEMFKPFLDQIENLSQKHKLQSLLEWVHQTYPQLVMDIKWHQPMFMDHGTFIVGFSVAKHHISIAPEKHTMEAFQDKIKNAGYDQTMMFLKVKNKQDVPYDLLKEIIDTNIEEKFTVTSFWR